MLKADMWKAVLKLQAKQLVQELQARGVPSDPNVGKTLLAQRLIKAIEKEFAEALEKEKSKDDVEFFFLLCLLWGTNT